MFDIVLESDGVKSLKTMMSSGLSSLGPQVELHILTDESEAVGMKHQKVPCVVISSFTRLQVQIGG